MRLVGWIIYHGLLCTIQILSPIYNMHSIVAVCKDHDSPSDSDLCVVMTTYTTRPFGSYSPNSFRIEERMPVF